jgi:hypothetical protein
MGWHILKMVNRLGDVEVLEAIEKRDVTSYSGLVGFFVGGNVRFRDVVIYVESLSIFCKDSRVDVQKRSWK